MAPDNTRFEFGRFAHVSVVDMAQKELGEKIILDLIPDVIDKSVIDKVVFDQIKKQKITKKKDIDELKDDVVKRRQCKLELAQAYGSIRTELIAKRYASGGVHNLIMGDPENKGFNLRYGMALGTYSNPRAAMLRITDPQIDEPAGAPRRNGYMTVPTGEYYEMDFNGWYPAVIAGLVDRLLLRDLYRFIEATDSSTNFIRG